MLTTATSPWHFTQSEALFFHSRHSGLASETGNSLDRQIELKFQDLSAEKYC